jgi:hypothetical protein
MICPNCSSSNFRLSSFRWKDLERLALLQYPIRCRNCHERTYGGLMLALYLAQTRKARRRKRSSVESR